MAERILKLNFPYFQRGLSFWRLPSTNDALAESARKGIDIQMVTAAMQSEGRGRRENTWHSPPGGLWISVLIPDIIPEAEMTMLNISCGLACVRACERLMRNMGHGTPVPFLRWPNDVMLNERKLGGMLIEVKSQVTARKTYVLGIGINVNQKDFPEDLREMAISLYQVIGRRVSRMKLLFLLLKELEQMIEYIREKGTDGLLFDWQQYSYELGRHIEITTAREGVRRGKVIGLGKKGELTIIDKEDEIVAIWNGYGLKILDK
jgi:BirA family biotin operon repressor/biotin-[acetyl-CoA-carboxylase] ligase